MSTSVVVEALPPAPPAADAPATTMGVSPTATLPQMNGVRSPASAPTTESPVANGARDNTTDVEMADPDTATATATTTATPTANGSEGGQTAEPMDTSEPAAANATESPTEIIEPKREPVEFTVRSPEDDARALAQAKRRLEIQIAFVEQARKKILDETHPDYLVRMVPIDEERVRLLEHAARQERYWTHSTSVIFDYECDEASSEFMMNCDKLRHEMLDEIHHEIEIINDQRKGSASARKTTRKTRSARSKGGAGSGSDEKLFPLDTTTQKVKKRVGSVYQQLENKLAQSEVDHDLRELHSSMDAVSKKRRMDATESPFVAKYHRATFLYRDGIYREGDEIVVRNLMSNSEYLAIICAITSTELFVLSEKGKYVRLVLMDLRQGRVVVSLLAPEHAANDRDGHTGRHH